MRESEKGWQKTTFALQLFSRFAWGLETIGMMPFYPILTIVIKGDILNHRWTEIKKWDLPEWRVGSSEAIWYHMAISSPWEL